MPKSSTSSVSRRDTDLGPHTPGSAWSTWRVALSALYELELPDGHAKDGFKVSGSTFQLPGGVVTQATGSAQIMTRTREWIAQHPVDFVSVFLCLSGEVTSDYDGIEVELSPGDLVFLDYARPLRSSTTDYECASITFNRTSGPAVFRTGALHGIKLSAATGAAQLLRAQLQSLLTLMDKLTVSEADAAVAAILSLAAAAWAGHSEPLKRTSDDIVDRTTAFIRQHIADATLAPEKLAAKLDVSRARLYRLFAPYGGVRNTINRMRLDGAIKALVESPPANGSVTDVAFRHGFKSEATFSRAFKKRFGRTPREVLALRATADQKERYQSWLKRQAHASGYETIDSWLSMIGTPGKP